MQQGCVLIFRGTQIYCFVCIHHVQLAFTNLWGPKSVELFDTSWAKQVQDDKTALALIMPCLSV